MPSSISSSDQRLPRLAWLRVIGGAVAIATAFVGAMEARLAQDGFRPSLSDSEALWIHERARASSLGSRALVLVGASRIQSNVDLDVLRARTALEPVQLGIPAASFVPVYEGLAADPAIRGTIVVDFYDYPLTNADTDRNDTALRWQSDYAHGPSGLPTFASTERALASAWRQRFASYVGDARPWDALRMSVLREVRAPRTVIQADRSRLVDFSRADVPYAYYRTVLRTLHEPVPDAVASWDEVDRALRRRIGAQAPQADALANYARSVRRLARATDAIRARGGQVYFVMLPKAGLLDELDERLYPRAMFWDRLAAGVGTVAIHFRDVPAWRELRFPDGSHLDFRDRPRFTDALVEALGLAPR